MPGPVTCNSRDEVFYDADLLIEGNRIAGIGKHLSAEGAERIDARGKYVYPGLVNTHHHFFQAFVRNLTTIDRPGMTVIQWLDTIYKVFAKIDSQVIYYASLACMADLIKHGCTCAFDHQYCYTPLTGMPSQLTGRWRRQTFWGCDSLPDGEPTRCRAQRAARSPMRCARRRTPISGIASGLSNNTTIQAPLPCIRLFWRLASH